MSFSVNSERTAAVFDAALGRLAAIGVGQERDPQRLDVSRLPPPEVLARLLTEIASVWRLQRGEPARRATATEIDSPEALVSFAAVNDIDVVFENRTANSLNSQDLPAVVLTEDGRGRMLIGRQGRIFTALHAGRSYSFDKDALAQEEAGTIFLVRPRGTVPSDNLAELAAGTASMDNVDPVSGILSFMTTRHRRMLVQLLVAAAFSNLMLLALPIYSGLIFDRVIPHSAFDTLWAISIGVAFPHGW